MSQTASCIYRERLDRLDAAIRAQKDFIARVPDPDNRCRAETNLLVLLEMRDSADLATMTSVEVH